MRTQLLGLGVVLAAGSFSQAQQILQLDVNDLGFQVYDAQGTPSAFGGVGHTGSVKFFEDTFSAMQGVLKKAGPGFPFINDPAFTGVLDTMILDIQLSGGFVVGGSLEVMLDNGDLYEATLDDVGQVRTTVIGGFTIDAATMNGLFSDSNFGGADVTSWFNAQGAPGDTLLGNLIAFKFNPNSDGAGVSDTDIFVSNVPAPAGLALLGLAGAIAGRRRR